MSAQWTAEIIGKLHLYNITRKQLADYMKLHPKYVISILNGKRTPAGAQERFEKALDELIRRKEEERS